jgi:hypothetical protein
MISEEEVIRHFPFLDSEQKQIAQRYFNSPNDRLQHHSQTPKKVYFVEQEFSTMDWQCRDIDPRWNYSLSVVILRHPIKRHLSKFLDKESRQNPLLLQMVLSSKIY